MVDLHGVFRLRPEPVMVLEAFLDGPDVIRVEQRGHAGKLFFRGIEPGPRLDIVGYYGKLDPVAMHRRGVRRLCIDEHLNAAHAPPQPGAAKRQDQRQDRGPCDP